MATIVTKRNLGQRVWTMKDNKAWSFAIVSMSVHMSDGATSEYYRPEGTWDFVSAEKCFDTKEELIASIFDNEKGDI